MAVAIISYFGGLLTSLNDMRLDEYISLISSLAWQAPTHASAHIMLFSADVEVNV